MLVFLAAGISGLTTTEAVKADDIFDLMDPSWWFDDDDEDEWRYRYGPGPHGWGGPWGYGYPPPYAHPYYLAPPISSSQTQAAPKLPE